MQKPGTDIRPKILPRHVFQLQCIIDSLTVSRCWSLNPVRGHVLIPPAQDFHPRRDVDLFMERDGERPLNGFCQGVEMLVACLKVDARLHGDPNRHAVRSALLLELRADFIYWLGETKFMHGMSALPRSRFSNTNSNGLWEYSPFLCGVGLVEALELAYDMGLFIWNTIQEPICAIHLHNMLVQKGYIAQPVQLYAALQELFKSSFFADGSIPTSNSYQAFVAAFGEPGSPRATFRPRAIRQDRGRTVAGIHGVLDRNVNRFFKTKSLLRLYREAGWVPDRIPDEDVPLGSYLNIVRFIHTKQVPDPVTGKKVMEDTKLVKRARSEGIDDTNMIAMASSIHKLTSEDPGLHHTFTPEGSETSRTEESKYTGIDPNKDRIACHELLTLFKLDIIDDVADTRRPLSGLSYPWITARCMVLFEQIENRLKQLRNPLWVRAYEGSATLMQEKRSSLAALVIFNQDEECMKVMAEEFQNPRVGFLDHIYWKKLDNPQRLESSELDEELGPLCTVM